MLLLRITPIYDEGDYCSDCGCSSSPSYMRHEEVSLSGLIAEQPEYALFQMGLARIKKGDEKLSPETIAYLKQYGWVHLSTIKSRNERKELEQKYYVLDEKGNNYLYYNPKFATLDLDNLNDLQIEQLAKGAEIVQKVSVKSVLSEADYKRYLAKKAKVEASAKKAKAAAEAKKAKKKAKEIEKAKKVLKEAGQLTEEK